MFHRAAAFRKFVFLFCVLAAFCAATCTVYLAAEPEKPAAQAVAQTPPMGWNSYDSYGALVTEEQLKANADFLAEHLKSHGYQYVVLDYCWSYPYRPRGGTGSETLNQKYNPTDNTFSPVLAMDANGRLIPDRSRFPSAYDAGGKFIGLNALVDYVHKKGLKLGLHIMRGIPRQAVAADSPILGTDYKASLSANPESMTSWLNHMYGLKTVDGSATGELTQSGKAYYDSIVNMYAAWGVDFIKADDMLRDFKRPNGSFYAGDIAALRSSIDRCGRPIVFSLSPGAAPLAKADELEKSGNMWRMLNDLWDNWNEVNLVFDVARNWTPHRELGHWPDADMIPLGKFVRPPVGRPRSSLLTNDEQRTVMTLWSIVKSPLMLGSDLPSLADDSATLALITNDAVLAVDQHSTHNRQISAGGNSAVWAAEMPDPSAREAKSGEASAVPAAKKIVVALFNRGRAEREVSVNFADLGLPDAPCHVKDLWTGADLGDLSSALSQLLPAHGAGLYELVPQAAADAK